MNALQLRHDWFEALLKPGKKQRGEARSCEWKVFDMNSSDGLPEITALDETFSDTYCISMNSSGPAARKVLYRVWTQRVK